MNAVKAIYQGRYRGGVAHANDGNGKPLCYDREYWNSDDRSSTTKWQEVSDEVTCTHCRKNLAKLGQLSLKKMTLREKLFADGH